MIDTPKVVKGVPSTIQPKQPSEPKGARIALKVCTCYKPENLIGVIERIERIASLLGITMNQFGYFVVHAVLTGCPVVVACYKQRDIAEEKLARLKVQTPFLANSCHSFELLVDELRKIAVSQASALTLEERVSPALAFESLFKFITRMYMELLVLSLFGIAGGETNLPPFLLASTLAELRKKIDDHGLVSPEMAMVFTKSAMRKARS